MSCSITRFVAPSIVLALWACKPSPRVKDPSVVAKEESAIDDVGRLFDACYQQAQERANAVGGGGLERVSLDVTIGAAGQVVSIAPNGAQSAAAAPVMACAREKIAAFTFPATGEPGYSFRLTNEAEQTAGGDRVHGDTLQPRFDACYIVWAKTHPGTDARARVIVTLKPTGEVASAVPSGDEEIGAETLGCLADALRAATFPPPGPSGSTLTFPFHYARPNR